MSLNDQTSHYLGKHNGMYVYRYCEQLGLHHSSSAPLFFYYYLLIFLYSNDSHLGIWTDTEWKSKFILYKPKTIRTQFHLNWPIGFTEDKSFGIGA